jgi:hypothetical protein
MAKQANLAHLLESRRFNDARELLQQHLRSGQLLDPRTDDLWAPLADTIAQAIQAHSGIDATVPFWEALQNFFVTSIEPLWGHAHKGHIYFRLAFAVALQDFARARHELELAYQQDILLETAKGGTPDEITLRSYNYSAYAALTIFERIQDADFPTIADKEQFVSQLFGPSFDAAIAGMVVQPGLVQGALTAVVPPTALPMCQARYEELQAAASLALPFAIVSLTGTVLESLLIADLYHRKGLTTLSNGKNILTVELGPLLQEAIQQAVFPTASVRAACQLVQIFRNRLHPGNELRQQYKLVPRVAMTLRVLFELALLEWRKVFP